MGKIRYNNEQIFELHAQGLTDAEMAEIIGVGKNAMANKRSKLGLKPNKGKRYTYELTKEEMSILVGTLLGDSSVRYVYDGCKFPNLTFSHGENQGQYFEWKANKLKNLMSSKGYYANNVIRVTGETTQRYVFTGSNMACLVPIRETFYPNKIKVIPIDFLEKHFTELSLYCLYMDDGSYDITGNSFIINTQCFTREDLEKFTELLNIKFGLKFNIKTDHCLYLRHESNDLFRKILLKYNECPDMLYKIGVCRLKTPLNRETPEMDNPVLNLQEIEENAERLEVMPNEKDEAIKSSTKAGHCPEMD